MKILAFVHVDLTFISNNLEVVPSFNKRIDTKKINISFLYTISDKYKDHR